MTRTHTTNTVRALLCRAALVVACALLNGQVAFAATYAVEEMPVGPAETIVPMKWVAGGPDGTSLVEGSMLAPLKLNTTRWLGKQGRVYMVLPPQSIGPVRARWTTRGALLPGELQAGNRTLVYSGTLPAYLTETLTLKLEADGYRLSQPVRLEFRFEIEVE